MALKKPQNMALKKPQNMALKKPQNMEQFKPQNKPQNKETFGHYPTISTLAKLYQSPLALRTSMHTLNQPRWSYSDSVTANVCAAAAS